jgi:hypothetical protein
LNGNARVIGADFGAGVAPDFRAIGRTVVYNH